LTHRPYLPNDQNVSRLCLTSGIFGHNIGVVVSKNKVFDRDSIFPKLNVVGSNPIARFGCKR
jgi:hypothetical protein